MSPSSRTSDNESLRIVDSNSPIYWSLVLNRYSLLMVFCCFVVGSWRLFRQVSWQSRWCRMSARSNLGWVSVQHPLVAMSSTVWIPSKGLSQGGSANQQPDCCITTIPHFLVALIPNSPYSSMSSYFSDDSNAIFLVSNDSKCPIVALLSPSKHQHWSLGSVGRKWPSSGFRTSWTFSSIPSISRRSPCPLKVQVGVMEPTAAKQKTWRTPERWLFSKVAALHVNTSYLFIYALTLISMRGSLSDRSLVRLFHALQTVAKNAMKHANSSLSSQPAQVQSRKMNHQKILRNDYHDYPISNLVDSSGDALQHSEIYKQLY